MMSHYRIEMINAFTLILGFLGCKMLVDWIMKYLWSIMSTKSTSDKDILSKWFPNKRGTFNWFLTNNWPLELIWISLFIKIYQKIGEVLRKICLGKVFVPFFSYKSPPLIISEISLCFYFLDVKATFAQSTPTTNITIVSSSHSPPLIFFENIRTSLT